MASFEIFGSGLGEAWLRYHLQVEARLRLNFLNPVSDEIFGSGFGETPTSTWGDTKASKGNFPFEIPFSLFKSNFPFIKTMIPL